MVVGVYIGAFIFYVVYLKYKVESKEIRDLLGIQMLLVEQLLLLVSFLVLKTNLNMEVQYHFQLAVLFLFFFIEIKYKFLMRFTMKYVHAAKSMIFLQKIEILFLGLLIYFELKYHLKVEHHIIFFFVNVTINLLIYYQFDVLLKNKQEREKYEIRSILEQKIRVKIDEIRSIQHEYANLLSIFQFPTEQLKQIMSEDFFEDKNIITNQQSIRKNVLYPLVRVTLKSKGELAKQLDIRYQVKIKIDEKFGIIEILKEAELVMILSNLIDNAIEQILRERQINEAIVDCIHIELTQRESLVCICVGSTRSDFTTDEYHGYMLNQYTTKENAKKHGFGLMRVRKIIEAYHGEIEAIKKNNLQFICIRFVGGERIDQTNRHITSHRVQY
ncbi:MAG: sensor histidine kinase [Vallitaleaceae bacterium]|nr:sensor histidine kinase [Vallitaleaceae bacterium]